MDILKTLTQFIGMIGVIIISWGVLSGLIQFIRLEIQRARGLNVCRHREMLRHHLGSYLLLGLEFLIAADVVHTVHKPSLNELAILGSIVVIRTILNIFLNRELSSHNCSVD